MNELKYNTVNLSDIDSIVSDLVKKPAFGMPMLLFWKDFDELEQKILSVIADHSTNPSNGAEVEEVVSIFTGFRDPRSYDDILKACNSLCDAEMLERSSPGENDVYSLQLPIYHMWLRENKKPTTVFGE